MNRRRRQPLRDFPLVLWFVAALAVALTHRWVPEATWLMIHVVMLGALSHAVLVWSAHFAKAILRAREDAAAVRAEQVRLAVLAVGAALVLVGVPTTLWPMTLAGAMLATTAVLWHGVSLWRQLRRALPGRFRVTIRYYLTAALALPVGAGFGTVLAWGLDDRWHARFLVAHSLTMLLGWIGLTVVGTLITFWPTVLRTRMDDRAESLAGQAFPVLVGSAVVVVTGALLGVSVVTVVGTIGYLVGLVWSGRALIRPLRRKPPQQFAGMSILAAMLWFVVAVVATSVVVATRTGQDLVAMYPTLAGIWVVGFGLQLVTGALSYLLPTVLGGGAVVVRRASFWFDRLAAPRLVIINAGLLIFLLPVTSWVRVTTSSLVLVALATFVVLMTIGLRAGVRAKRAVAAGEPPADPPTTPVATAHGWTAGVVALAMVTALGASVGSTPSVSQPGEQVAASGRTVEVQVEARGMTFVPDRVEVGLGDTLVITVINQDPTTVHDLQIGGQQTPRLAPGQQAQLVFEAVSSSMQGWCTLVGHRQMGMTFTVTVAGSEGADQHPSDPGAESDHGGHDHGHQPPLLDVPLSGVVDPAAPKVSTETVHRIELRVAEVSLEVAPGVWQKRWTYNGSSIGPTLRGKLGDQFEITLVNDGSMGHSIDFHASALAPDEPMRTIAPGESLTYSFTAVRAGIWMYHCSTMPMSAHIAAGMAGAVIIDPPDLPQVDREYVLVQSEIHLSDDGTDPQTAGEVDADTVMAAGTPSFVVFNGIANQYVQAPLTARVGERIRIWVLDVGPNRASSFHIVGAQFDTVYLEGGYRLVDGTDPYGNTSGGSQALGLLPAQGGFVELSFPEPGHYSVVNHVMADAERGARGIFAVTE